MRATDPAADETLQNPGSSRGTIQRARTAHESFAPNRLDTQNVQSYAAGAATNYSGSRSRAANQFRCFSIRDCCAREARRLHVARFSDPSGAPQRISTESFGL